MNTQQCPAAIFRNLCDPKHQSSTPRGSGGCGLFFSPFAKRACVRDNDHTHYLDCIRNAKRFLDFCAQASSPPPLPLRARFSSPKATLSYQSSFFAKEVAGKLHSV